MTVTPPHRVVLTPTQLSTIHTQIQQATSSAGMLAGIFAAMRAMVYDPIDRSAHGDRDPQAPPRRVRVTDYAIPTSQWRAIHNAALDRAQAWGTEVDVAVELMNYLPGRFDDPTDPAPTPAPIRQ